MDLKTQTTKPNQTLMYTQKSTLLSVYCFITSRYAVLHSVTMGSGPTTNSGTLNSFVFAGTSDSYVELDNTDGQLDGNDAMCWAFYVRFSSGAPEATLLQYFGDDGTKGFKLLLKADGTLKADFFDDTGADFTSTSSFSLTDSAWHLIGINFNTLWASNDQFDLFYFSSSTSVTKTTIGLGKSLPVLDAKGTVRLGASHDGSLPFNGQISCVQFYQVSLIGKTQKSIYNLCDPNLISFDYGKYHYGECNRGVHKILDEINNSSVRHSAALFSHDETFE